ncbi:plasmodesmata callose-binding protein 5 [Artemisia annua]|uniref:Plasmodesmata callose-binding protein 5 n=1 Tax=Artemisia annua TaxID=35608 RepID=A0A2U1PNZ0_ARTAN|nr:plasmodesmata callose-binding protein 5 [Artemisia annua]
MTEETCNFASTAALTDLDPSFGSCKFPSSMEGKSSNGTAAVGGGTSTADLTSNGNNVAYGTVWVWCWCYAIIHLLWLNFV